VKTVPRVILVQPDRTNAVLARVVSTQDLTGLTYRLVAYLASWGSILPRLAATRALIARLGISHSELQTLAVRAQEAISTKNLVDTARAQDAAVGQGQLDPKHRWHARPASPVLGLQAVSALVEIVLPGNILVQIQQ
jgi:hypothetical protein